MASAGPGGPDTTDTTLWDFLRGRGVSESGIREMQQDKLHIEIISEVEDSYLARYIPAYGDRIATRRFCMEKKSPKIKDAKKMSILHRLQKKMKTASGSCGEPSTTNPNTRKNAVKTTRKIEFGWLHEGKQIRKRSGGGTRLLSVSKDSTKEDLLKTGKDLFFQNGESQMGKWEEFYASIEDFKESPINDHVTVGELYNMHKFGILRFYLSTRFVTENATPTDTDLETIATDNEDPYNVPCETVDLEVFNGLNDNESIRVIFDDDEEAEVFVIGQGIPEPQIFDLDDTLPVLVPQNRNRSSESSPINREAEKFQAITAQAEERDPVFPVELPSVLNSELEHKVTVEIHRVNVLQELISHFKNEEIMTFRLKFKFVHEKGADADGLARDVYSAFWSEFVERAAEGAELRVPVLTL
ncbi:unnamed protein product [Knipowitschia caucasica]